MSLNFLNFKNIHNVPFYGCATLDGTEKALSINNYVIINNSTLLLYRTPLNENVD